MWEWNERGVAAASIHVHVYIMILIFIASQREMYRNKGINIKGENHCVEFEFRVLCFYRGMHELANVISFKYLDQLIYGFKKAGS
jgi:hypothetical protein